MKAKITKIFAVISLFLLVVVSGVFVACGKKDSKPQYEENVEYTLSAEELTVNMSIFDTKTLEVDAYKNSVLVANPALSWESSDETVLTVNNGVLIPIKCGEANIIVSYETESLSIKVIVDEAGETPILQVSTDKIDLLVTSDPFPVESALYYDGVVVEDALISYSISEAEQAFATVDENGVITPISEGKATVKVVATWRGVTNVAMQKDVEVTIKQDVEIRLDKQTAVLYAGFAGDSLTVENAQFNKTGFVSASVYVNNELQNDSLVTWYTSNQDVVLVNNGTIEAVKEGTAEVWCSFANNDSTYTSAKVEVEVLFPELDKTDRTAITFEKENATLSAQTVFGSSFNGEITNIYDAEAPTVSLYENNSLNLSSVEFGERKFVVCNSEGYSFKICAFVVTMSIDSEVELVSFIQKRALVAGKSADFVGMTNAVYSYGANEYYVLGANITMAETIQGACYTLNGLASNIPAANIGFQGMFDGRGYTIYGEFGLGGLFGDLAEGALVKNLAVVGAMKHAEGATAFGTYIYKSTIDNCYFELDGSTNANRHSGLVCVRAEYFTLKNSVLYNKAADLISGSYTSGNFETYGNGNANLPNNTIDNVFMVYRNASNASFANSHATAHQNNAKLFVIEGSSNFNYGTYDVSEFDVKKEAFNNANFIVGESGLPVWKTNLTLNVNGLKEMGTITSNIDGKDFASSAKFEAVLSSAGVEMDGGIITWYSSDESIVSITNDGDVTAQKAGIAFVWCECIYEGQKYVSDKLEVSVVFPYEDKSQSVSLELESKDNQTISAKAVFGESYTGTIQAVYSLGNLETNLYENGALNLANALAGNQQFIVVGSAGNPRLVSATIITQVIDTYEELLAFVQKRAILVGRDASFVGFASATYNYGYGEYYVLGADITMPNMVQGMCYTLNGLTGNISAANIGFQGTFDGRGYTISGTFGRGGIFGDLAEGAVVKNLAVIGVVDNQEGATALGTYIYKTTIDNCYFELDGSAITYRHAGLVCVRAEYITMTNCVLWNKAPASISSTTGNGGNSAGNFSTYGNGNANTPNNTMKNVLMISRTETNQTFAASHGGLDDSTKGLFELNDSANTGASFNYAQAALTITKTVSSTTETFSSANFNSAYWNTTVSGVPQWKGLA